VHRRGEAARDAIEAARAQVAALIGALPEEIVFTASASESNNLALKGVLGAAASGRRRLVVSAIEHPSVLETARHLETRGTPLTVLPVGQDGRVDAVRAGATLGADVALVSMMLANNETGAIQPVREIAGASHAAGALVHCDAVQAVGKLSLNVDELGVDLLSLSGHKFGGPAGVAALYVRRRTRLLPLVHGGHQEKGRRAGTENLPGIVGLGAAAARAAQRLASGDVAAIGALGTRLREGLLAAVPDTAQNGVPRHALPTIVNLCFRGVDGEAALHELDREGVTVSTGSACSAASPGPSHVLLAMGLRPEDAHASVRFSLGDGNGADDVERILSVTPRIVERLRALAGVASREESNR
jgi:cysteine desulfurase